MNGPLFASTRNRRYHFLCQVSPADKWRVVTGTFLLALFCGAAAAAATGGLRSGGMSILPSGQPLVETNRLGGGLNPITGGGPFGSRHNDINCYVNGVSTRDPLTGECGGGLDDPGLGGDPWDEGGSNPPPSVGEEPPPPDYGGGPSYGGGGWEGPAYSSPTPTVDELFPEGGANYPSLFSGRLFNSDDDLTLYGRGLDFTLRRRNSYIDGTFHGNMSGYTKSENSAQAVFGRNLWDPNDPDNCSKYVSEGPCKKDSWKETMNRVEEYFLRDGRGNMLVWRRPEPDATSGVTHTCDLIFPADRTMSFLKMPADATHGYPNPYYVVRSADGSLEVLGSRSGNYFLRRVTPYASITGWSKQDNVSSIKEKYLRTQQYNAVGAKTSFTWNAAPYADGATYNDMLTEIRTDLGTTLTFNYLTLGGPAPHCNWPDISRRLQSVVRNDGEQVSYSYNSYNTFCSNQGFSNYYPHYYMLQQANLPKGKVLSYAYGGNSYDGSNESLTRKALGQAGSDQTVLDYQWIYPRQRIEKTWNRDSLGYQGSLPHKAYKMWSIDDKNNHQFGPGGSKFLCAYERDNNLHPAQAINCDQRETNAMRLRDEDGVEHLYRFYRNGCLAMEETILDPARYRDSSHPLHGVQRLRTQYSYVDMNGDGWWSWSLTDERKADLSKRRNDCLVTREIVSKVISLGYVGADAEEQPTGYGDQAEIVAATIYKYQVEEDLLNGRDAGKRNSLSWAEGNCNGASGGWEADWWWINSRFDDRNVREKIVLAKAVIEEWKNDRQKRSCLLYGSLDTTCLSSGYNQQLEQDPRNERRTFQYEPLFQKTRLACDANGICTLSRYDYEECLRGDSDAYLAQQGGPFLNGRIEDYARRWALTPIDPATGQPSGTFLPDPLSLDSNSSLLKGQDLNRHPGNFISDGRLCQMRGNVIAKVWPVDSTGHELPLSAPAGTPADLAGYYGKTFKEYYSYNRYGLPTRKVDAAGRTTLFKYYTTFRSGNPDEGGAGLLAEKWSDVNGANQLVERYEYDNAGRISAKTDPRGKRDEYVYNGLDQLEDEILCKNCGSGQEIRRHYVYDSRGHGRLERIEESTSGDENNADGSVLTTRFVYNAQGKVTEVWRSDRPGHEIKVRSADWQESMERPRRQGEGEFLVAGGTALRSRQQAFEYDEEGRLITSCEVTATDGFDCSAAGVAKRVSRTYDPRWGLSRSKDQLKNGLTDDPADGDATTVQYSEEGSGSSWREVATTTDPLGHCQKRWSDKESRLTREQKLKYCMGGQILAQTEYFYDAIGRLERKEEAVINNPESFPWDGGSSVPKAVTRFWYNEAGQEMMREINNCYPDPESPTCKHTARNEYNGLGLLSRSTDEEGNLRDYTYHQGLLIKTAAQEKEAGALRATYYTYRAYDTSGRLVEEAQSDDPAASVSGGAITCASGRLCNKTTTRYNSRGLEVKKIDPLGNVQRLWWDGLGRKVRSIDEYKPSGYDLDRDGSGPLLSGDGSHDGSCKTSPGSGDSCRITQLAYYDNGWIQEITDDNGARYRAEYNDQGRLAYEYFAYNSPDQRSIYYDQYDVDGNLRHYIDRRDNQFTLKYDSLNRLLRTDVQRAPGVVGTTAQRYSWNALGQLSCAYDNNDGSDTVGSAYEYDSLSRPTKETTLVGTNELCSGGWFSAPVSADYRPFGDYRTLNYSYTQDDGSTAGWWARATRDGKLRLKQLEVSPRAPASTYDLVAEYSYWGDGRLHYKAQPSYLAANLQLTAGYDPLGRRQDELLQGRNSIVAPLSTFKKYTYGFDPAGDIVSKVINERRSLTDASLDRHAEVYAFDSHNRLIHYRQGVNASDLVNSSDQPLYPNQSLNGRMEDSTFRNLNGREIQSKYNLDSLGNRLDTGSGAGKRYGLSQSGSAVGPRQDMSYACNLLNEYTQAESQNTSRDASGGLTALNEPGSSPDPGRKFILDYDAFGRLVQVFDNLGGSKGTRLATYRYRSDGRRAKRCANVLSHDPNADDGLADCQISVYRGPMLLAEMGGPNSSDFKHTLYRLLPGRNEKEIVGLEGEKPGRRFFLQTDLLGSVVLASETSGAFTEKWEYDAYGRVLDYARGNLPLDRYFPSEGATKNPYLFAGYPYDEETGFYYLRNRYYDPVQGRFLTPDPQRKEGLNLYEYVLNNPLGLVDPSGLASEPADEPERSILGVTPGGASLLNGIDLGKAVDFDGDGAANDIPREIPPLNLNLPPATVTVVGRDPIFEDTEPVPANQVWSVGVPYEGPLGIWLYDPYATVWVPVDHSPPGTPQMGRGQSDGERARQAQLQDVAMGGSPVGAEMMESVYQTVVPMTAAAKAISTGATGAKAAKAWKEAGLLKRTITAYRNRSELVKTAGHLKNIDRAQRLMDAYRRRQYSHDRRRADAAFRWLSAYTSGAYHSWTHRGQGYSITVEVTYGPPVGRR